MDATTLARQGFSTPRRLDPRLREQILAHLPRAPGVFAIIAKTHAKMGRGTSDVCYIGVGANANGIQMRIRQIFHPGHAQSTNLSAENNIANGDYALVFATAATGEAAKSAKASLLDAFAAEHGQLPPWNKRH